MISSACHNKALASRHSVGVTSRRNTVIARAFQPHNQSEKTISKGVVGRRDGVLMGLIGGVIAARPAQAGLFGGISEDVYVSDTSVVLGALKTTLELTADSENKETTVDNVR